VAIAATVGGSDSGDGFASETPADGALDIGVDRADDGGDPGSGVAEQIVDVPVAGVVVAGRDPAVAIDPGETARAERAPGVGVDPFVEVALASRAERDRRRLREIDQEGIGPARHTRHCGRRHENGCDDPSQSLGTRPAT